PEGAVRLTGPSTVTVDVTRVPTNINTLRFAVSMDDSTPGTLAGIGGLGATLGQISAPALGLTTERAAILAEIYRRGDQWKIRNVSAGWDSG
ncbi:tellurium resistance protein, partial [Pseudomonas sp. GW704-F2]